MELKVGQLWVRNHDFYDYYRLITKIDGDKVYYINYSTNFKPMDSTYNLHCNWPGIKYFTLFREDGVEFLRVMQENNKILEDMTSDE